MPVQVYTQILCLDMLVQQTPKALEWENGSVRKKHGLRHIKSLAQMQTDKGTETKKSEINHTNILYI